MLNPRVLDTTVVSHFLGESPLVALAHQWAQVMHDARRAGRRLESGDAWIAATPRLLGAPLLTHDRDFSPEACPSITIYCHA